MTQWIIPGDLSNSFCASFGMYTLSRQCIAQVDMTVSVETNTICTSSKVT